MSNTRKYERNCQYTTSSTLNATITIISAPGCGNTSPAAWGPTTRLKRRNHAQDAQKGLRIWVDPPRRRHVDPFGMSRRLMSQFTLTQETRYHPSTMTKTMQVVWTSLFNSGWTPGASWDYLSRGLPVSWAFAATTNYGDCIKAYTSFMYNHLINFPAILTDIHKGSECLHRPISRLPDEVSVILA